MPRLPPAWVKAARTSAAVRLRLSVSASQSTATPAGAVALVHDGLVVGGVLAGTEGLVDGGLDLVLGQGVALGLLDGGGQRCVVVGVRVATLLGSHGDVARQLGEQTPSA